MILAYLWLWWAQKRKGMSTFSYEKEELLHEGKVYDIYMNEFICRALSFKSAFFYLIFAQDLHIKKHLSCVGVFSK